MILTQYLGFAADPYNAAPETEMFEDCVILTAAAVISSSPGNIALVLGAVAF